MSNFTPLVKKQYEFEGDTVTVEFSRLKRKHMLTAVPLLNKINTADASGDDKYFAINELLSHIIDELPKYVTSVSGLVDSAGNEISIQTIVDDFYFMKLAAEIAIDMVSESTPESGKA